MELKYQGVSVSLVEPGALRREIFDKAAKSAADEGLARDPDTRRIYLKALRDAQAAAAKQPGRRQGRRHRRQGGHRPPPGHPLLIGRDARALSFLRFLPDRLRNLLLLRTLGLGRAAFATTPEPLHQA